MNFFYTLILLLNVASISVYAQEKESSFILIDDDTTEVVYKSLVKNDSRILTKMRMVFKEPQGFKKGKEMVCFKEMGLLSRAFNCLTNQFLSDDGQFIAFMPIYGYAKEDSIKLRSTKIPPINTWHLNQMKRPILILSGREEWKKFLQYYPQEIARSKFHADTVIRFSIPLQPDYYYEEKYRYFDALFIQKNGVGYVNFYCFYTKKAKNNLDKYWIKIEEVLKFEE